MHDDVPRDKRAPPAGPLKSEADPTGTGASSIPCTPALESAPQPISAALPVEASQSCEPNSADEFSFYDLIEGGGSTIEVNDFGSIANYIDNFDGFEAATTDLPSGVYEVGIEESELRSLVTITGHAVHGSGTMSWVELRLQAGRLRGRSFNRDLFADCSLRLLASTDAPKDQAPIAVIHDELARALAGIAIDARLRVDGPGKTLIVRSHGFERPIRLQDASKFVAPTPGEIGVTDIGSRRSVSQTLLRTALDYLTPFANPDKIKDSCGYVELREGTLHSWTHAASAHVRSSALPDWIARIPYDALRILPRVLDDFPETFELLTSGRFLILMAADGGISFGIGAAQPAPANEAAFVLSMTSASETGRDRILVPRSALLLGLSAQRALDVSLTRWICAGAGKVRCVFRAENEDGKRVDFPVDAARRDGFEAQRRADLPLAELIAALHHDHASENATLDLYWDRRQMRIAGPELTNGTAQAVLAISSPDKERGA